MTWKEELRSAEAKAKKEPLPYSAQQKVQAVRSIWSERRGTREVCRELAIHSSALYAWERRALQAMFQALEPARGQAPGPALSPKLERLLARQALQQKGRMAKLEKRLAKLQEPKSPPPTQ
jgi:transposase-like protein